MYLAITTMFFYSLYTHLKIHRLRWSEVRCKNDRSFMVDPLSYFSFQPVLHDWCDKGCGMCYPVSGIMHMNKPLLLIENSSPCFGSGFPISQCEWSFSTVFRTSILEFSIRLYHPINTLTVFRTSILEISTTGVTKAVVCAILSVGWCI